MTFNESELLRGIECYPATIRKCDGIIIKLVGNENKKPGILTALKILQSKGYNTYGLKYSDPDSMNEPKEIFNLPDIKKLERVCKKNIPGFTKFILNPEGFDNFDTGELWLNFYYTNIDHYSYEEFRNIDDFLKHHKVSIENFLFNPCVVLDIYNDNDYNGNDYTGR